jgi:undecaprenyl-diphosphatase
MNIILLLKAAILGIVEGATEFIPVSSTGHLILAQNVLGFTGEKENAFIISIQLGAILAVLWLYRHRIGEWIWNGDRAPQARRLVVNLLVGMVPAAVIGLPTKDWVDAHFFKPFPVSLALIAGGLAIILVERWHRKPDVDALEQIPVRKAFGVGLIQVLAILFPGVSRSAATIMGGMALGLSRRAATEFSFFMAIPAMVGSSVVELAGARDAIAWSDLPLFAVGFLVSFVTALAVIRGLLIFVSNHSFVPFAWYRILMGAVLLLYMGML